MTSFKLIPKGGVNKMGESYFGVRFEDLTPLKFLLANEFLLTARGVYTEFKKPNSEFIAPIHTPSVAYQSMKAIIKPTSSKYLDIVLDITNPEDNAVYQGCLNYAEMIRHYLTDAIVQVYNDQDFDHINIINYIRKNLKNMDLREFVYNDINIMFVKDNASSSNIKYVHLKVTDDTITRDVNDVPVIMDNIMYKRFKTKLSVILDNVRIPATRNDRNKLNVHFAIVEQIVKEYKFSFN